MKKTIAILAIAAAVLMVAMVLAPASTASTTGGWKRVWVSGDHIYLTGPNGWCIDTGHWEWIFVPRFPNLRLE